MHKLEFITTVAEGFKSIGKKQRIRLGRSVGLVFLTGKNHVYPRLGGNGIGKTTIWDALVWCLFGKTTRGVRAKNIRNWYSLGSVCRVAVFFKLDGIKYKLVRTWSPNTLRLQKEGEAARTIEQQELEHLLNIGYSEFCGSIIFPQSGKMFFDLGPTERLKLFTAILNLDRWENYGEIAKQKLNVVEDDCFSIEKNKEVVSSKLKMLNLEDIHDKRTSWKQDQNTRLKEQLILLKDVFSSIKNIRTKKKQLKSSIDKKKERYEELEDRCAVLSRKRYDANKLCDALNAELFSIRKNVSIEQDALKARKKLATKGICPVCAQNIDSQHMKEHIQEARMSLLEVKEEAEKVAVKLETMEKRYTEFDRRLVPMEDELSSIKNLLYRNEQDLQELEKERARLLERKRNINERISEIRGMKNPYADEYKKVRGRRIAYTNELKQIQKDLSKAETLREGLSYWPKGFQKIRLFLVDTILKQLELEVNTVLAQLGMEQWTISFKISRPTASATKSISGLHISIHGPRYKKDIPWESWSGGESQRLRIAGQLGLSNLILHRKGLSPNIQILDEPTSWLSEEGVEDVLDTLTSWAQLSDRQVWLVDHRAISYSEFVERWRVDLHDDGSRIFLEGV